jgi:hypothetical protein
VTDSIRHLPTERSSDDRRDPTPHRDSRRPRAPRRPAMSAAAAAMGARFRIAAHVVASSGPVGSGTFVSTGLVADSGTLGSLERLRHAPPGARAAGRRPRSGVVRRSERRHLDRVQRGLPAPSLPDSSPARAPGG